MSRIGKYALTRLLQMGQSAAPPLSDQPGNAVLRSVWEASKPSRVYWLMNALATLIACYGLLANSTAVLIGAMVVAMLLGPISGVARAEPGRPAAALDRAVLADGRHRLDHRHRCRGRFGAPRRAAHQRDPVAHRPRLFELIIALAGGAAGAVVVVWPQVGTAIVGVAVATALVPPLASAGRLPA